MTLKDRKEKLSDSSTSLLNRLNDRQLYSDADWTLAQFIYNNMVDVIGMTVSELAEKAYSSAGTIVRLSKALGYSGFKELKLALVKELESSKYVHQSVNFNVPFSSYSSSQDIVNSMASLYREGIDILQSTLNARKLDVIADKILHAKRLFLFGIGDSLLTCELFANKLIKINYYAILATERYDEGIAVENLSNEDMAMFITYTGNEKFIPYVENDGFKKAFVVTITANGSTPLAKESNEVILIKNLEGDRDERTATFYSQLAFHYVLNCIFSIVYAKDKKLKSEREIRKKWK